MATDVSKLSAEAQKSMQEAQKLQDVFLQKAQQGTLEQQAAFIKMAEMQKKIAEQNQEYLKSLAEIEEGEKRRNELIEERNKLLKAGKKETDKEIQDLDKKIESEKELHNKRILATSEIKKQTEQQRQQLELLTKEKGIMGELATAAKNKLVQQLVAVATFSNALKQLSALQKDMLDISVLSGNYKILDQSYGGLAVSAAIFEKNMKQARVGLRFLGYDTAEVDQSFKEFNTSIAMTGVPLDQASAHAADATEVTGRLARMLGVTLSDATQYSVEMTQRFNQTTGQTASAMMEIYKATDKYNQTANKTVMVARDVTKVMFDLAREMKSVAIEQAFLSRTITQNVLALQSQGKNYRESLEQASMYVKKMSAEAPDWTKILAGRELDQQMKQLGTSGGESLRKRLEEIQPGLASRVEHIMKTVTEPYTRQRMLQDLLEGTSVGFTAMEKAVGNMIDSQGKNARIALSQIYGISLTQADAMIEQVKISRQLEDSKQRISKLDLLSGDARQKEVEALAKQTGISKERIDQLSKIHDGTQQEAFDVEMRLAQEKQSLDKIKEEDARKKKIRDDQIKEYEKMISLAQERGDIETAAAISKKKAALEGTEGVKTELEKKMATIQGGPIGEGLSAIYEAITSSTAQLLLIAGAAATQTVLQGILVAQNSGIGKTLDKMKDLAKGGIGGVADLFKGAGSLMKGAGSWKTAGRLVKGAGVAGTVLSAAADVYDIATAETKEQRNKAIAGTAGMVVGGALGSLAGPIGTAVGAELGRRVGKFAYGYFSKPAEKSETSTPEAYTSGAALMTTPVSSPAPAAAGATGAGLGPLPAGVQAGAAGAGGAVSNRVEFQTTPIPGAQGVDVEFIGKIPFAQLLGMNMDIIKRGASGVTP